ncbi:MAG: acyl-CoA desaturase [Chloroflexi bacterium]|nr:acyl-CoA desaturase [Chloroflexota bacterium]
MTGAAVSVAEAATIETRSTNAAGSGQQSTVQRLGENQYVELKRLVKERGLLEKQPRFYIVNTLFVLSLVAASVAVLVLVDAFWIQLLNAAFLAFAFTQISFLGHDASHRQIFRSPRNNNIIGSIYWNVLLGMSNRWFIYRHSRHHASPNEMDADPDADMIILSLSEEQARRREGFLSFLVKYQLFLLPLLTLEMIVLQYASFRHLRNARGKYPLIELPLIALHYGLYFGLAYIFLGLWPALLFVALHQLVFGSYFSSVIASNHKGMPMLDGRGDLDFLHQQVLTARNVRSSPLIDFWYGGLNFQIEHHLFPNMPRNKLRDAQTIVRRFCAERGIAYYETGLVRSFADIYGSLREISAVARRRAPSEQGA